MRLSPPAPGSYMLAESMESRLARAPKIKMHVMYEKAGEKAYIDSDTVNEERRELRSLFEAFREYVKAHPETKHITVEFD
jgi:hypothetical protein